MTMPAETLDEPSFLHVSVMLPEVVMHRRLHPGSQGVRKRADRADYARVLGGWLERRRRAP